MHLQQLDAVAAERGDDGERSVADPEGVDADGAGQPYVHVVVGHIVGRLERAVLVHPRQQGGALAERGHDRVRAAFRLEDRRVARAGEVERGGSGAAGGRKHGQGGAAYRNVLGRGQRPRRPPARQGRVCGVARPVRDRRAAAASEGQGIRSGVVQVGGLVARLHRVLERQYVRAAARAVRGAALPRLGRQAQQRNPLHLGPLVKVHGNVDDAARAVHGVRGRRRDALDERPRGVDRDVVRAAERAVPAGRWKPQDGIRAVGAVADVRGDVVQRQGRPVLVFQVGRIVALLHLVPERQHLCAAARVVRRVPRRLGRQRQPRRARHVDRDGEPDVYVDDGAPGVRAACVGRGDAGDVRDARRVDCDALRGAELLRTVRRRKLQVGGRDGAPQARFDPRRDLRAMLRKMLPPGVDQPLDDVAGHGIPCRRESHPDRVRHGAARH